MDKGTYDAISLCPDNARCKRRKYIDNVADLLGTDVNEKGLLIITSCNWTEEELTKHFQDRKL